MYAGVRVLPCLRLWIGLRTSLELQGIGVEIISGNLASATPCEQKRHRVEMKRAVAVLIVSLTVGLSAKPALAETLKCAAAEWRPWQIVDNGQLKGITPDILHELGKRTGTTMNIRWMPHKRVMIAFEKGIIDMEPTVNPAWRETSRTVSVYTNPFYTTRDIILIRKELRFQASSVRDFYGMTLGCGLGYYYPEGFQKAFEEGHIFREDNPVSEKNLAKLLLKRIDGIIVDMIQARYIMKKRGIDPGEFFRAYAFKPSQLCMRLHHNRKDLLPILNHALESMQADGTIDRLVARHVY